MISRRRCAVVLAVAICWPSAWRAAAQEPASYAVMTFNIRYGTANDKENRWEKRKDVAAHVVAGRKPDLLGMQEALRFQINFLIEQCPEYEYVGVGRDDGKERGEHNPVLYRKDRFERLDSNTLWLSDTPDKPGSITWGNTLPRIVTYAILKDRRCGREILFAATHFCHVTESHRQRSAEFLKKRLPEIAGDRPILLVGDFNAGADSAAYRILVGDPTQAEDGTFIDTFIAAGANQQRMPGTFGGFAGTPQSEARIDWIVCSKQFTPRSCEILHDNRDGRYPSDHYPVLAVVELK